MSKWISGVIKHPGALTKAAHSAGESPMQYAEAHKHSSGVEGKRARLAITLRSFHHKGMSHPAHHTEAMTKLHHYGNAG